MYHFKSWNCYVYNTIHVVENSKMGSNIPASWGTLASLLFTC